MGTTFAPLLADLFLQTFEYKFIKKKLKQNISIYRRFVKHLRQLRQWNLSTSNNLFPRAGQKPREKSGNEVNLASCVVERQDQPLRAACLIIAFNNSLYLYTVKKWTAAIQLMWPCVTIIKLEQSASLIIYLKIVKQLKIYKTVK